MCGRYTLTLNRKEIRKRYSEALKTEIKSLPQFQPHYNASPMMDLPIMKNTDTEEIQLLQWGFTLRHNNDKDLVINARKETIDNKPLFSEHLHERRCIIPTDGYYEWNNGEPYYISPVNEETIAFAGIWRPPRTETIQKDLSGNELEVNGNFVVLTQNATDEIDEIHDRMPVILTGNNLNDWLLETKEPRETPELKSHRVSPMVNDPSENHRDLIRPIE